MTVPRSTFVPDKLPPQSLESGPVSEDQIDWWFDSITWRFDQAAKEYGPNNPELIAFYCERATVEELAKDYEQAAATLQYAVALCAKIPEGVKSFPDRADTLLQLSRLRTKMQQLDQAEALCLQVIDLEQRATGSRSSYTRRAIDDLSIIYHEQGNIEEAKQLEKFRWLDRPPEFVPHQADNAS